MPNLTLRKTGSVFEHSQLIDMPDTTAVNGDHDARYAPAVIEADCTATEQVGDPVYISGTDAVRQADASSITTGKVVGIISEKMTATTCRVQVTGSVTLSGLTAGSAYFLSETTGQITTTIPTASGSVVAYIGQALSSTNLLLNINPSPMIRN